MAETERRTAAILEFVDETEAAQLSARDARFADILATVPGSIADYLDVTLNGNEPGVAAKVLTSAVVNLLRDRVAAIRALPLDASLRQIVAGCNLCVSVLASVARLRSRLKKRVEL